MHIEPGVVDGAKMVLSYGTAAAAAGYTLKLASDDLKTHSQISFVARTVLAAIGVFVFFEVLPAFPGRRLRSPLYSWNDALPLAWCGPGCDGPRRRSGNSEHILRAH